ncbi:CP2 transcription factor-domain-containing protein [Xylaria nigripes]|nr:CP2 transcription factor-domain-containing protein [Xylaria nigripes]
MSLEAAVPSIDALHEMLSGVHTPVLSCPMPGLPSSVSNAFLGAPGLMSENIPGHPNASQELFQGQDPTPRASYPECSTTTLFEDLHPFSFQNFVTQPESVLPPTSGGATPICPLQAGGLHTMAVGLCACVSIPHPLPSGDGTVHTGPETMDWRPAISQPSFHQPFDPLTYAVRQQPSFTPASFVRRDVAYETLNHGGTPISPKVLRGSMDSMDTNFQSRPQQGFIPGSSTARTARALSPTAGQFRFQCTLNAPSARLGDPDKFQMTYLNKGQAYAISIIDTAPHLLTAGATYRTHIRVSFDENEFREKPGESWGLWKEGRGKKEAPQRGGRLQAVEYVDATQSAHGSDGPIRVVLESALFDGFCVAWTPSMNVAPQCNITVRFNFLSTDFSHSKGVRGTPVRLCAKTSIVLPTTTSGATDSFSEICYCNMKLFRDHGAERKMNNDITHVKRNILKYQRQLEVAVMSARDCTRRGRGGVQGRGHNSQRSGRMKGRGPNGSGSRSSGSTEGGSSGQNQRSAAEDDARRKTAEYQGRFTTTRPISHFYLPGGELDDPDLYPVSLPGGDMADSPTDAPRAVMLSESPHVSPTLSLMSLQSQHGSSVPWIEGHVGGDTASDDKVTRIPRTEEDGTVDRWIDVLGVDPSYRPPGELPIRPIACFYVARRQPHNLDMLTPYKAVYLYERSLPHFVVQIARIWNLDPIAITRVVHIVEDGTELDFDDNTIVALPEGQDMIMEVPEMGPSETEAKTEWDMALYYEPVPLRQVRY